MSELSFVVEPDGGGTLTVGSLHVRLTAREVHALRAELSVGRVVVDNQTGLDLLWSLTPHDIERPGLPRGRDWMLTCRAAPPTTSKAGKVLKANFGSTRKLPKKRGDTP